MGTDPPNEVSMMKRPHLHKAVISETISRLKQRARVLKREKGLSYREALEMAATEGGYPNWHLAIRAAETDPASRAQADAMYRRCYQPLNI